MSEELTLEEQATNAATLHHILTVQRFMHLFAKELLDRALAHDQSKLRTPEVEMFAEFTPKLAASTYGSAEYEEFRKAMGPALAHHYANNRHHPEHFKDIESAETADLREMLNGLYGLPKPHDQVLVEVEIAGYLEKCLKVAKSSVGGMNLMDVVEMFCDWKAATMRHNNGNLRKSIEHNANRFGLSPQLVKILENTADIIDRA